MHIRLFRKSSSGSINIFTYLLKFPVILEYVEKLYLTIEFPFFTLFLYIILSGIQSRVLSKLYVLSLNIL